ncbi:uncharacterized protein LOC135096212 [Scylla paramamosain]|uniref:uncharacterized protein LOC135096212 n=1 Tax=Scylla paramamosain TaxID=85552 RepID=UPI003082CEB1
MFDVYERVMRGESERLYGGNIMSCLLPVSEELDGTQVYDVTGVGAEGELVHASLVMPPTRLAHAHLFYPAHAQRKIVTRRVRAGVKKTDITREVQAVTNMAVRSVGGVGALLGVKLTEKREGVGWKGGGRGLGEDRTPLLSSSTSKTRS